MDLGLECATKGTNLALNLTCKMCSGNVQCEKDRLEKDLIDLGA